MGGVREFPKNLKKINGKSVIQIVCQCISKTKYIDKAIISSDSKEIINEGTKFGLASYFVRPKELSGDNVADIPVLLHGLLEVEKHTKLKFDIIIMLQPTAPLRKPEQIEKVIKKLINVLNFLYGYIN